jgi:tRNA(adenine34) deaminase
MFMQIAIEEAVAAAKRDEVPVGAVLVDMTTGDIIARRGNEIVERNDPTAHAEMLVIRDAAAKLRAPRMPQCALYVTLEPCPMCSQAIAFARIKHLYFGADDPKGGGVLHGPKIFEQPTCHHKIIIQHGEAKNRCGQLLKDFFKAKRS